MILNNTENFLKKLLSRKIRYFIRSRINPFTDFVFSLNSLLFDYYLVPLLLQRFRKTPYSRPDKQIRYFDHTQTGKKITPQDEDIIFINKPGFLKGNPGTRYTADFINKNPEIFYNQDKFTEFITINKSIFNTGTIRGNFMNRRIAVTLNNLIPFINSPLNNSIPVEISPLLFDTAENSKQPITVPKESHVIKSGDVMNQKGSFINKPGEFSLKEGRNNRNSKTAAYFFPDNLGIVKKYMENNHVRIHTDFLADTIAANLGAEAFTVGSDIFFKANRFHPATDKGASLLLHELIHVRQQRGNPDLFHGGIGKETYLGFEKEARTKTDTMKSHGSGFMPFSPTSSGQHMVQSHGPFKEMNITHFTNVITPSPQKAGFFGNPGTNPGVVPQLQSSSPSYDDNIPIADQENTEDYDVSEKEEEIDYDEVAARVYSLIQKKLRIEQERRGKWRMQQ